MIVENGLAAYNTGHSRPAIVPRALEGEYLARNTTNGDGRRPASGASRGPVPLRPANGLSVETYLQTGRPWAAPRQGRHIDLYV